MAVDYSVFINRILEILQADPKLKEKISEFRFGDVGDNKDKEINANSYPLCYVTTATNPDVSRKSIFAQGNPSKISGQKRELEFWAIIVVQEATPEATQKKLYRLTNMAEGILEQNQQLYNPTSQSDRLCSTCDVFTQKRFETYRGKLIEAMTIRIRPTIFVIQ